MKKDPKHAVCEIADLTQNPDTTFKVLTKNMPTLCRNSCLVSLKQGLNIPIIVDNAKITQAMNSIEKLQIKETNMSITNVVIQCTIQTLNFRATLKISSCLAVFLLLAYYQRSSQQ